MEITEAQFRRIDSELPRQRGNVRVINVQVLNALLYVAEEGCKWRELPRRFGPWHTIYTRMNRWSKNGVLDSISERLQREQIVRIKFETIKMDSTIVKVLRSVLPIVAVMGVGVLLITYLPSLTTAFPQ